MTNSESLHKILKMRCNHHTKHAWQKETHADIYPVKLCPRKVQQQILKMERWNLAQHVLQQASLTQDLTAETEHPSERDEAILSALPVSETHTERCQRECVGCRPVSAWNVLGCDMVEWNHTVT